MSIFQRMKSEIRYKKAQGMGSSSMHNPVYTGGKNDTVVLPEKPKKKRKLMEVQRESKDTLCGLPSGNVHGITTKNKKGSSSPSREGEIDDEEMVSDDDDHPKKRKKIPWGPPEILDHLNDPSVVGNINGVIENLKKTTYDEELEQNRRERKEGRLGFEGNNRNPVEVVWDHSETKEGKKSDNNFFIWFETMAANETKKVMAKENLIYE